MYFIGGLCHSHTSSVQSIVSRYSITWSVLIQVYLCCHVHQVRQLQPSSLSIFQEVQQASYSEQKHMSCVSPLSHLDIFSF